MKRDLELVRDILAKVEELPYDGSPHSISLEGRSQEEIAYHVLLLNEAGLIEARDFSLGLSGDVDWRPKRLTYTGHEFLDNVRSNKVWEAAKNWASSNTGGALTVEAIKLAIPEILKRFIQGE